MGLFTRKPKDAPAEEPVEDLTDPEAFLAHLVEVATMGAMEGSEESAQRTASHLATDMEGHSHMVLAAALGMAVIAEGAATAAAIKRKAFDAFAQMMDSLAEEEGQERPTDLLADDEPTTAPEAASEPQEAAEKVWPEDRR